MVVWESRGQDDPAASTQFGVYGRVYRVDGTPLGGEFRVNSATANDQRAPKVAATTAGEYVAAWESKHATGTDWDVYARRFSATGAALGDEFRVNVTTAGDQRGVGLGADVNGNFVVAWQAPGDGNKEGVFVRLYDSSGVPTSGEIPVNTFTPGSQLDPDVAVAPDGSFAVTWKGFGQDSPTDTGGVYGQRFDSGGNRVGGEFRVNSTTAGTQQSPMIGITHDGAFLIVWESIGQDGSEDGLFGQFYAANGARVGSEAAIATSTAGNQEDPAITGDVDGNFVVSWESDGFDGSSDSVVARRFTPLGQPIDAEEFVLAFKTVGSQRRAWVSADDLGNFAAVWQGPDGSSTGIFARQFLSSGAPAPTGTPTPTRTPTSTAAPTATPTPTASSEPTPTRTPTALQQPTATPTSGALSCDGLTPTIVGTDGADTITGTAGNDVIHGRGGNDRIDGMQGDDVICSGDGNDVVDAGGGRDRLFGGIGDDVLKGTGGNDTIFGEGGNDTLDGGGDVDHCDGGDGTDSFNLCETSAS